MKEVTRTETVVRLSTDEVRGIENALHDSYPERGILRITGCLLSHIHGLLDEAYKLGVASGEDNQ